MQNIFNFTYSRNLDFNSYSNNKIDKVIKYLVLVDNNHIMKSFIAVSYSNNISISSINSIELSTI